jgi:hypothetical protein
VLFLRGRLFFRFRGVGDRALHRLLQAVFLWLIKVINCKSFQALNRLFFRAIRQRHRRARQSRIVFLQTLSPIGHAPRVRLRTICAALDGVAGDLFCLHDGEADEGIEFFGPEQDIAPVRLLFLLR